MSKRYKPAVFFNGFLLSAGMVLATPAFAEKPWISVPSTANENQQMVVSGGGLPPNSTVTLQITYPTDMKASQVAWVDGNGHLSVIYPLSLPGGYGVEVLDTAGKLIGSGRLGFIR
jgi:hypothetical protein